VNKQSTRFHLISQMIIKPYSRLSTVRGQSQYHAHRKKAKKPM